ncbi:MAG TPA: serine hydrolase domain-containing protein [Lunatimonas sp.]|nr:serine hydrolase domain-containing protein [Lunatimonas sp.]
MKTWMTIGLCLVFLSASAQQRRTKKLNVLEESVPTAVGMSPDRLQCIDVMIQEQIDRGTIPGAVALVARNGKIVYHKAFGKADANSDALLGKDQIFRLASQTKAITSTAVMMLWEEGKFRLDDPISKYIPAFENMKILETFSLSDTSFTARPASKEITIRHLLTHTSGIGYGMIDPDERIRMIYTKGKAVDAFTTNDISIEAFVNNIAKLPLHFNPGEKYQYSYGLDVLGYLVEIVSKMPFDQFLRQRLFDPLGMDDTWFYLPEEKASRLVKVQEKASGAWQNLPEGNVLADYPIKGAQTFFAGGAGLVSTARDYALFLQMYLNGGNINGHRFLSPTTIKVILDNHTADLYGGSGSYHGLAFSVLRPEGVAKGGSGSAGTFSWGGYFNTQYFADPQENVIGILLKQTVGSSGDETGWKFQQLVGAAIDD